MSYEFAKKEIGDYRITVFQDEDAECPCSAWDLAGVYLWDYSGCGRGRLSDACNWEEIFYRKYDTSNHSLEDALRELVYKYVPQNRLVKYLKSNKHSSARLSYNRSSRIWELDYCDNRGVCQSSEEFTPDEIKNYDMRAEMIESMTKDDLIELLNDIAYEIVIYEWSSTGYCQGDYVAGIAYCDKARFKKMVDENTKDWKNRALALFEDEVKNIGIWMWGDVKGYVLEKKRPYTKLYEDGGTSESYDWEQIDSCCGEYFEDADDLIEEVIREHGIQPKDAA
jgi:hypothetical protein